MKWLTTDRAGGELVAPTGRSRWVRPTPPVPRPGRRELAFDFALALVLSLPYKAMVFYTMEVPGHHYAASTTKGAAAAVGIKILIPMCMRRRFPLAALWVLIASLPFVDIPLGNVAAAVIVCCYSAAVYSPYRRLALCSPPIALLELSILGYAVLVPGDLELVIPIAIPLIGALAFYGTEVRRAAYADVDEQRRRRAEEQQDAIRRAVEDERSRIARELHDVVTHNVSVMVVMAGAARKVLERSPEEATEALLEVEAAGRAAMGELRQVMGLLTDSHREQHRLAPQPGLDQMGTLIARIRATGVRIGYRVVGEPCPLPPGIDLTAYRVVQEALTNTVKHAAGAAVEILLEYHRARLVLEVCDSGGVPGQTASTGGGKGLIGLRERVAMHGGDVQAGPRTAGGYRVRVQIPLPVEDAA